jgi:hypothetical protein
MKKLLLTAAALVAFGTASAQDSKFGLKAGYTGQTVSVKTPIGTVKGDAGGFYAGAFADFGISDKFIFHPEVEFIAVSGGNTITAPLLAKYMVADKFALLAGPGLYYNIDAASDNFSVSGDIGASYDINDNFLVDARYDIGLSGDIKQGGFFIGVGYKF